MYYFLTAMLHVITSTSPDVIRFEVVKAKSQFDVAKSLQAEVLVPPDLIVFPGDADAVPFATCAPAAKCAHTANLVAPKSIAVAELKPVVANSMSV